LKLIEFSLHRRVTVAMVSVALVLFGFVAFGRLAINLLPELSYPSLTVETELPGAAPGEVEALVSRPLEEVVGVVAGVKRLSSVSRPGISQVTLEFDWDRDMDFAALDVREKLDLLRMPEEAGDPIVLRFDPGNDPIQRLYLQGDADLFQLRYVAEEVLKKDLESTEGVAAIKINGGYEEEIQVRVDEGKLSLLGLNIADVNDRLLRANVNQAGGSLYEAEARYLVRASNEFLDLDDVRQTVVLSAHGRTVRIEDVAEVRRGHKKRDVITRFGGGEAVELAIYKEGDANTVQVARAVERRIEQIKEDLPGGIELTTGVDQSEFIEASIREVLLNAAIGGGIAILVLLFFLRDGRSTLIIGISIPISVVATFFLMYRTGTTLNVMSLGGLALGVGMLVDNAIVVLEAIFRHREAGKRPFEAALAGGSEVGRAVAASTLTTVAVFLPVVFLEGVAAQLFRDMALTVSFSLLASLAVSLTLIPMMASLVGEAPQAGGPVAFRPRAFREDAGTPPKNAILRGLRAFARAVGWVVQWVWFGLRAGSLGIFFAVRWILHHLMTVLATVGSWIAAPLDRILRSVVDAYPGWLRACLRVPIVVLGIAVLLFAGAVSLIPKLGFDLIPAFSQGEFSFQVELPEGTPLDSTDRFIQGVEDGLSEDERVDSHSSIVGGRGLALTSTGTEGENTARLQVTMADGTSPADEMAVIRGIRERLEISDRARYKFERPTYFSFRTPVEVEVYGERLGELFETAAGVRDGVAAVPGVVDVKSSAELGNPELQISFQRNKLARLGLNLGDVAATVRNKVQGEVATRYSEGDREIDIVVRSVDVGRASVDDVQNFIVGQRDGVPIFLKSIASIERVEGPTEIRRIGQRRAAVISGNLNDRDVGTVAQEVRSTLQEIPMPAGVTAVVSGQEEERAAAQSSLLLAMALAIFLVYLVMASQFESFVHPFIIIFTLPLGAIGVIGALALTGRSINVVAMIGAVMLAGIVVNNAIVLVDAINQRRRSGEDKYSAIVSAGSDRLRPILMTSATTILGLLPMAVGIGEGAELRAPLAVTVIGGLTVATGLTLFVIPVVYALVDRSPAPVPEAEGKDRGPVGAEGALPEGVGS